MATTHVPTRILVVEDEQKVANALREGLRALGYVEGQNIHLEFRTAWGHADRLAALAEEAAEVVLATTRRFAARGSRFAAADLATSDIEPRASAAR